MLLPNSSVSTEPEPIPDAPNRRSLIGKMAFGLLLFFAVVIFGLAVSYQMRPTVYPKPPENNIQPTPEPSTMFEPLVLGWIPYWDQKRGFESFRQNVALFDFVSFFWYRLDSAGNIRNYQSTVEDESIIDFAHENGVKVSAVIANLPDDEEGGDWDWRRVDRVISSSEARQTHIQEILALLDEKNLDGVNIDYEALRRGQREDFSLFVEELAFSLHEKGKILGVSVHPKTSENNPEEENGSQAQDLQRLSNAADHLYFMTYDEHNELTPPGPVGSLSWMERVLDYAIDDLGVLKEKVFVGIPLYGYDWSQDPSQKARGLEFDEVKSLVEQFTPEIKLNSQVGESSFGYANRGIDHIVWFNDAENIAAKLNLAKKLDLGGVAFWRLGREDPKIWELFK